MKKTFLITIFLIILFVLVGNNLLNLNQRQVSKDPGKDDSLSPETPTLQQESKEIPSEKKHGPLVSMQVKVKGMDFGIGSQCEDILTTLGSPKEEGIFEGSYYLSYEQIIFFLDSMERQGRVASFAVWKGMEIERATIGMTPDNIKKKLGSPLEEGVNPEKDYYLLYKIGNNSVIFFAKDENSPTTSALVKSE
ncbi:DUF4309 domain-containing protein [Desulforamulus aeronauticus]|uniref:DUF4309 domain-containing protein n=1 Tax=Desulforamulus aeronauticus DSM 10349 TaxID=1121421 RepID=A0A1M6QYV3_9FIRM|nr:DUF4309 domain-containing protein [Desulforamulus aeronauticus]SHK25411.1 protein of unknown function [Desulforamulus aeronauticus DSM 10349]